MGVFSKFSIRKLLFNKKFAIILSTVLAFVIWLSIVTSQTPVIERTITNVPIVFDTQGTIAGDYKLEVINYSGTRVAEVKVSGPAYVVSQLTADDIEVRLVLSSVSEPDEYNIQLRASQKIVNSEYSITGVTPSSLNLRFDRKSEKTVNISDITADVAVTAAEGYHIYKKAVSTAVGDTITVTGPRTEIEKISQVKAVANVTNGAALSAAETYSAEIVFYDEQGSQLDSSLFEISSPRAEVYVTVYKTKTVELNITAENLPSGKKIKYDKKITVMGPADVIGADSSGTIEYTVDYNKVKITDNAFKISLTDLGLGAEILTQSGESAITVTVN